MERLMTAKVERGRVAIHWLGQGGFVFKPHSGDILFVDPYLSDSANNGGGAARLADIPIKARDVRLDYLFLTHDHVDHTDPHSAPIIAQANPDAIIICPPSCAHHLKKLGVPSAQIQTAMPGQAIETNGFVAHVVRAAHTEDSVGFVFEFNEEGSETEGVTIYITGDTEYNDSLAPAVADLAPDVLIVPINGRWGNMTAAEAARLAAQIGPREAIPMHYGMFAENTADPDEFVALLAAETHSDGSITPVVMKHNTCHFFCLADAVQGKYARQKERSEKARVARSAGQHQRGQRSSGSGSGRAPR